MEWCENLVRCDGIDRAKWGHGASGVSFAVTRSGGGCGPQFEK